MILAEFDRCSLLEPVLDYCFDEKGLHPIGEPIFEVEPIEPLDSFTIRRFGDLALAIDKFVEFYPNEKPAPINVNVDKELFFKDGLVIPLHSPRLNRYYVRLPASLQGKLSEDTRALVVTVGQNAGQRNKIGFSTPIASTAEGDVELGTDSSLISKYERLCIAVTSKGLFRYFGQTGDTIFPFKVPSDSEYYVCEAFTKAVGNSIKRAEDIVSGNVCDGK